MGSRSGHWLCRRHCSCYWFLVSQTQKTESQSGSY
ncbi:hypothetical protein CABS03_13480 [Colletotrichum abscissum]|uniref:Uncharacterized protein n=1 Tax=Colletotrichum abscissum TaxID=1671311 RepID=A0A9P9X7N2_9PEZI|nr:hypothetical protein CABS02_11081 [Colletotrichum abscissum]